MAGLKVYKEYPGGKLTVLAEYKRNQDLMLLPQMGEVVEYAIFRSYEKLPVYTPVHATLVFPAQKIYFCYGTSYQENQPDQRLQRNSISAVPVQYSVPGT